jgi:hypothetical protein
MWSRCGRFGLLLLNANSVHDIALHKFNLGQHRREFNLTMCIAQAQTKATAMCAHPRSWRSVCPGKNNCDDRDRRIRIVAV